MTSIKKQRIGYVLRRFPSISETFILNEVLEMEAQGADVEVYSILQPRDPRFHDGVVRLRAAIRYIPNIYDLESLRRYNARARKRFGARYWKLLARCALTLRPMLVWRFLQGAYVAERAAQRKVTHLHAHFANRATSVARMASLLSGIPYSCTAHAVDIFKEPLNRTALRNKIADAAFVATVSESNRTYLEDFAPDGAGKFVTVYNGIELDRFSPGPAERSGAFEILCVARFVEKKGLDVLIDACAALETAGVDFRCRIIGKGMMREKLVEQIAALGLEDRVKLLGVHTQAQMVERYRESDIFVLPCVVGEDGNRDGLPVSIVEALACGLPVITTPVSGIPEAVQDGVNGLIVPEGDRAALGEAMLKLAQNADLRARLAGAARASVSERFCIHAAVARLRGLFADAASALDPEAARKSAVAAAPEPTFVDAASESERGAA